MKGCSVSRRQIRGRRLDSTLGPLRVCATLLNADAGHVASDLMKRWSFRRRRGQDISQTSRATSTTSTQTVPARAIGSRLSRS
jgi:hypothetical protein